MPRTKRDECVDKGVTEKHMQMETKFLRLHTEVTLGSWFGDWQVSWLGGWTKHRLNYMVMVVKVPKEET